MYASRVERRGSRPRRLDPHGGEARGGRPSARGDCDLTCVHTSGFTKLFAMQARPAAAVPLMTRHRHRRQAEAPRADLHCPQPAGGGRCVSAVALRPVLAFGRRGQPLTLPLLEEMRERGGATGDPLHVSATWRGRGRDRRGSPGGEINSANWPRPAMTAPRPRTSLSSRARKRTAKRMRESPSPRGRIAGRCSPSENGGGCTANFADFRGVSSQPASHKYRRPDLRQYKSPTRAAASCCIRPSRTRPPSRPSARTEQPWLPSTRPA